MNNLYDYEILNYWDNNEDLYVSYTVTNNNNHEKANAINYYNFNDLKCEYGLSNPNEIKQSLLNLLCQNNGIEFSLPKVSKLSSLLTYIYDYVCESDSNMCHIDYADWEELKNENEFLEEDINTLHEEIKKYHLDNYITLDDFEYKICGYGDLQCCFNDDRDRTNNYER